MDGIAIRKSQHLIKFPFVIVLIENCTIRPLARPSIIVSRGDSLSHSRQIIPG